MQIKLYHPTREISFKGPKPVSSILLKLGLPREAHLVICEDVLVTEDTMIADDAVIEIRPVISGGRA
ncbi:MAG: MoaD/ThiS family protein [Nitrospirae bacterium]|nr:MoaD/ThiS family protein [Candidatus Manganitrophaceae bacterium]